MAAFFKAVLNYLPESVQPKAKSALHEIWMVETRAKAQAAFERFVASLSHTPDLTIALPQAEPLGRSHWRPRAGGRSGRIG